MNDDLHQLIDDYIRGDATPEQVARVKALRKSDSDFDSRVRLEENIARAGALLDEDSAMSENIRKVIETEKSQGRDRKRSHRWILVVVITAILLLLGYLFFFNQPEKQSHQELALANFEVYPNVVTMRIQQDSTPVSITLLTAMRHYDSGAYDSAFSELSLVKEDALASTIAFYQGQIAMINADYELAQSLFQRSLRNDDADVARTTWYLALSHLARDNRDSAIHYLDLILTQHDTYQENARSLKEALE